MGELLRRANLELGGAVPQRTPHSGTAFKFFFLGKKEHRNKNRYRKKIENAFSTRHTNTTAPYVWQFLFFLSNIYGIN
jgi:hypothetical protein